MAVLEFRSAVAKPKRPSYSAIWLLTCSLVALFTGGKSAAADEIPKIWDCGVISANGALTLGSGKDKKVFPLASTSTHRLVWATEGQTDCSNETGPCAYADESEGKWSLFIIPRRYEGRGECHLPVPPKPRTPKPPYPLHWQCGDALAEVSKKTGKLTVRYKSGKRVTVPFAWFEEGEMLVPWECEEQSPCAIGANMLVSNDPPPELQLYGFPGLNDVECKPRQK